MDTSASTPTTSGVAFRVSILGSEPVEAYPNVHAVLDSAFGVVHVFSPDGQTHYLTIPLGSALIEWKDPAVLQPQLRLPALMPGAFEQFGEQVQRMVGGMGRTLGQDREG